MLVVKGPVRQRFQLDDDPWPQRIDALDQVNIDHAPIVDAQRLANRVLRDLQTTIQVAPERRLEKPVDEEGEVAMPCLLLKRQGKDTGKILERPLLPTARLRT